MSNNYSLAFTFGRYNGSTVEAVGAKYDGYMYLKWFVESNEKKRDDEMDLFSDDATSMLSIIKAYLASHDEPVLSWEEKLDYKIRFGKYKDTKVRNIARTMQGRSYLQYISTWENFSDRLIIQDVMDNINLLPPAILDEKEAEERSVPFGPHRGRLIRDLKSTPSGLAYLEQLSRKLKGSKQERNRVLALEIEHCLSL
jgi:hypothetical protein